MTLVQAIAVRLKQLLDERGFSQYELFKRGGVPRSTICDTMNCKKSRVSTATIYQICSTLGISMSQFFDDKVFDEVED